MKDEREQLRKLVQATKKIIKRPVVKGVVKK